MSPNKYILRFIVILAIFILFSLVRSYYLGKNGVITIAKVTGFSPDYSGVSLYLIIYINGKEYKAVADAMCQDCIGEYFFVKIIRRSPTKNLRFFENKPVPQCILSKPLPIDGWKNFPTCE